MRTCLDCALSYQEIRAVGVGVVFIGIRCARKSSGWKDQVTGVWRVAGLLSAYRQRRLPSWWDRDRCGPEARYFRSKEKTE
ncbi:hypothetical protein [Magnetospirillum molischianum]|uniref:hypothetical protein n=1 Tax=Magnetospirillum molischianum TaxID=1083 RepID=UPI0012DEB3FF|nr:hypothetical protein [Magnetospirillum molischianum]